MINKELIFAKSKKGRKAFNLPVSEIRDYSESLPKRFKRTDPIGLPEISENELMRHMVTLSIKNYHIDKNMYPLGSCTMKYNPKVNELTARMEGFAHIHPLQDDEQVQGALALMYHLQEFLAEISGMKAVSLQPAAGAQGEFAGILTIRKYHEKNGELEKRRTILVPNSAHGTNPASAALCGFKIVSVNSLENGQIDIEDLKLKLSDEVAGMMLTNPNTLGIFESNIETICKLVHDVGGLMYMDGANLNAILGLTRPGDMGFDVMHFNLHKTFSTPHGGGGPGSGPIGVGEKLFNYLPKPVVEKRGEKFVLRCDCENSIGRLHAFWGNFGVMVRAYTYILLHGSNGLKAVAENAIINANYILHMLKNHYDAPYASEKIMHEAILSSHSLKKKYDVSTLDVAKRLMDYQFHPPTVYFPLIVHECLMIEPTETESKERLDAFCQAMIKIAEEAATNPEIVKNAPHTLATARLDDAYAAKNINVCCMIDF